MSGQSESLVYSKEKIMEMCSWRYFQGFTGDTCGMCKSRCNVLDGSPGWMCPNCGCFNALHYPAHGLIPFDTPDYGPTRALITEAYSQWKSEKGVADG